MKLFQTSYYDGKQERTLTWAGVEGLIDEFKLYYKRVTGNDFIMDHCYHGTATISKVKDVSGKEYEIKLYEN